MAIHLRAARINAGLKQSEVAQELGINKNTVISYEQYKTSPDIATAKKMARLYNMDFDDIIWLIEE
jgi:putative transcriptional regulator